MNSFRSRRFGALVFGTVVWGGVLAPGLAWAADGEDALAVVVNKNNTVENVTQAQLCKILMGQAAWSSGKPVSALLRSSGPEREIVLHTICSMSGIDFMQTLLKSGGTAPKSLSSDAAVKQLVTTLPGAIGFLHMADVTDAVRIVKLDGAAPGDPGYKLKLN
jgi:hypothetical protein